MSDEARKDAAQRVRAIAHETTQLRKRLVEEVLLPPAEHDRIKSARLALERAADRLDELANELDPRVADTPKATDPAPA